MSMKDDIIEMKKDIKQLLQNSAQTKEHLKALNGKVSFHENFIINSCPQKYKELERKILFIDRNTAKIMGSYSILITIVVTIISLLIQKIL